MIRTYIFHLRDLIEKADDLDEPKREVLLRRLSEFEAELDKKRLNLIAVTVLAITLAGAPGALWSSADVANKLLTNILRVVGGQNCRRCCASATVPCGSYGNYRATAK